MSEVSKASVRQTGFMETACYKVLDSKRDATGIMGEVFVPQGLVGSPWGSDLQHAGPVTGLLARALEQCGPRDDARITRVAVDILGPVPIREVEVRAWVVRPGRRIELLCAEMFALDT